MNTSLFETIYEKNHTPHEHPYNNGVQINVRIWFRIL